MNRAAKAPTYDAESDIAAWVVGSGIVLIQACAVIPGLLPVASPCRGSHGSCLGAGGAGSGWVGGGGVVAARAVWVDLGRGGG